MFRFKYKYLRMNPLLIERVELKIGDEKSVLRIVEMGGFSLVHSISHNHFDYLISK